MKKMIVIMAALVVAVATGAFAAEEKKPYTLEVGAGLGYDTNIFRAPEKNYFDPNLAVFVLADKKSGFYMPIFLNAGYERALNANIDFLASYALDGDIYPGNTDGNTYSHKLRAGLLFIFKGKSENNGGTFYVGPFYKYKKQTYVDRDTGDPAVTNVSGTDISDMFTYRSLGLEAEYKRRFGKFGFMLNYETAKYDYNDPVVISEYDNDEQKIGAEVSYRFSKATRIELGYERTDVDYDDRRSRNLNGTMAPVGETLSYTFDSYRLTFVQDLGEAVVLYLEAEKTNREDGFVGYNDYDATSYGGRIIYRPDKETKLRLKLKKTVRDYPRAFAFELPGQKDLEYDILYVSLNGERSLGVHGLSVWADLSSYDYGSTDPRYSYTRTYGAVGIKKEF